VSLVSLMAQKGVRMRIVTVDCPVHGRVTAFQGELDGQTVGGTCPKCSEDRIQREEAERMERNKNRDSDPEYQLRRKLATADVPDDAIGCRFSNFEICSDLLGETVSFAKEVASGYKRSIVLLGPTGVGKTHLGCAVLASAALQGRTILYTKEPRMLREVRGTFGRRTGQSEQEVFGRLVAPDVLVIDELSDEPMSKYEQTFMEDLIDDRITRHKGTVLISNAMADAYKAHLSDKIRSRLVERGATFALVGDDWRRRHA
jgi:DNA replication protein DnaC